MTERHNRVISGDVGADERRPQPPLRFRRIRAWLSRQLLGVDLTSELAAIHVALAEAIGDLGDDIRGALEAQNRLAATQIMKRADLLAEQLDRKTEGMAAALSRRVGALERAGRPMSDRAYAEFENRVRGSEEEVREHLRQYVDHFRFVPVVDLGCGRGELLEELRQASVPSYGVDSNKAMMATARAKGLRVLHEDLFDHLGRLEDGSLGGIAATHVIEHLTPPAVRHLFNEARRVLTPGGTLVVDTPNAASLWAWAQSWSRDPTHRWAPHLDTLTFMAEQAGLRVTASFHGSPVPDEQRLKGADPDAERLNDFLYGPQDLVLVAEKALDDTSPDDHSLDEITTETTSGDGSTPVTTPFDESGLGSQASGEAAGGGDPLGGPVPELGPLGGSEFEDDALDGPDLARSDLAAGDHLLEESAFEGRPLDQVSLDDVPPDDGPFQRSPRSRVLDEESGDDSEEPSPGDGPLAKALDRIAPHDLSDDLYDETPLGRRASGPAGEAGTPAKGAADDPDIERPRRRPQGI